MADSDIYHQKWLAIKQMNFVSVVRLSGNYLPWLIKADIFYHI